MLEQLGIAVPATLTQRGDAVSGQLGRALDLPGERGDQTVPDQLQGSGSTAIVGANPSPGERDDRPTVSPVHRPAQLSTPLLHRHAASLHRP
jgi:hypothetical protein